MIPPAPRGSWGPALLSLRLLASIFVLWCLCMAGTAWADRSEAEDAAEGRQRYRSLCLVCHGSAGDGRGPAGVAMTPKPRDLTRQDFWDEWSRDRIKVLLRSGKPRTAMRAFPELEPAELDQLISYLESFQVDSK